MAYLPGFENDIFISYVHDNNQDGWVTKLHNDLQKELDGSFKGVKIWRDRELNGNIGFDEKIRKTIEGSAIFLVITSKRYLLSEYRRQGLEWFHGKAKNEPYGLSVNNQYRIFNALIHNIEYEKWPKEFSGITGLQLFDSFGKPLRQDEKTYELQVRKLSVEIEQLILALDKEIGRVAKETSQKWGVAATDPPPTESNRQAAAEPLPQARRAVKTPTTIFISYRRQDSDDVTGRIYDRLVQQFGKEAIFKDVDSIPLGVDFRGVLDKAVGQCNLLLAVLGRQWLSSQNESGARRLDDPRNFVRIEIEAALQRDIPVIPLLVQGAGMPGENDLPPSLHAIVYRNAIPIRPDPDFHTTLIV